MQRAEESVPSGPVWQGDGTPPTPGSLTPDRGGKTPAPVPWRGTLWRAFLVTAIVAALIGAGTGLVVARATGWGRSTTVIESRGPGSTRTTPADIPAILAKALPSVVEITATMTTASPFPFGTANATGTGIVVSRDGEILTNDHVVRGASSIDVLLDGTSTPLPASIVGESPQHDVALLKIGKGVTLVPATFGHSSAVRVGDPVLAVGYALALRGGPSVTDGIVSATGRTVSTESATGSPETLTGMIQTDAAISSGNSGGPLLNGAAQVIGINTMVAASGSDSTAQNIGFAIPSDTVETLLPSLRAG